MPAFAAAHSATLAPELIHRGECFGAVALERVPASDICHRGVTRVCQAIIPQRSGIEFESEEGEFLGVEKILDLRNGESMLLHVEHEVAASAGAEEIRISRQRGAQ